MAGTGAKFPGTGSNVDYAGSTSWTTPSNITADDASVAYCTALIPFDNTDWLRASNFSFGIPAGSTIDGMEATVVDYAMDVSAASWQGINIFDHTGSVVGDSQHTNITGPVAIPNTDTVGGVSDLWGLTPTDTQLSDIDWGFGVRARIASISDLLMIDALTMTIYYTSEGVLAGGTVTTATETHIAAGGRTVILVLLGVSWVAAGATFDAQRQGIIDGITSAQSETLGWNNEVRDTMSVARCVRTSDSTVTITLLASEVGDYKITADEVLTATVPATAHTGTGALVNSNFATITAECDQTLAPGTIITQTNLTGSVTDIDEPVDSPDANWLLMA